MKVGTKDGFCILKEGRKEERTQYFQGRKVGKEETVLKDRNTEEGTLQYILKKEEWVSVFTRKINPLNDKTPPQQWAGGFY